MSDAASALLREMKRMQTDQFKMSDENSVNHETLNVHSVPSPPPESCRFESDLMQRASDNPARGSISDLTSEAAGHHDSLQREDSRLCRVFESVQLGSLELLRVVVETAKGGRGPRKT